LIRQWPSWLLHLAPQAPLASAREKFYGCLGAGLGLLLAEWLSRSLLGPGNIWFVAPMGASAVLLFAVPSSPLAQPWAMLGGNMLSALIGVACGAWIPDPGVAASLAAALAIYGMFALRCLHPPGGAMAMTAILGGPAVHAMGFRFVLNPVALNSLLLLLLAVVFNKLLRRNYPHRAAAHHGASQHDTLDPLPSERLGFSHADLNQVLLERGQLLDINQDDLEEVVRQAELHAHRRRFGAILCGDIMSRDLVSVRMDTTLESAWALLAQHKVKALPVIDRAGVLLGIVSLHDFFINRHAPASLPMTPLVHGLLRIQDIMTRDVVSARADQPITELVRCFSDGGLHDLPVLDPQKRIIGMISQSDLLAALYRGQLAAHLEQPVGHQ
jgi:CBS domain-containing membrane protein